jgi:hypothetical protein
MWEINLGIPTIKIKFKEVKFMYCLCDRCVCNTECEYYRETVKPVAYVASEMFGNDDEFVLQIREVVERFKCDYFEQQK